MRPLVNLPRAHRGVLAGMLVMLCCIPLAQPTNTVAQAREVVFDVKIEQGRVPATMRTIRVAQGDAVRLRLTSDRPITLHLHGYDIEVTVEPGAVADMTFTARATGRFPLEEHKPQQHGGHSHGEALVRVEIRPR